MIAAHLGAYVGADLVAGLLATGLAQAEGVRLLMDVGTNTGFNSKSLVIVRRYGN